MITLISKGRKAGIESFLRPHIVVGKPKKLQISAFQIYPSSESTYWDNSKFIKIVRTDNLYRLSPLDLDLFLFQGKIAFIDLKNTPVATVGVPFHYEKPPQISEEGLWCIIIRDITNGNYFENEMFESLFRVHIDNWVVKTHLFTMVAEQSFERKGKEFWGNVRFPPLHIYVKPSSLPEDNAIENINRTYLKINQLTKKESNKIKLSLSWFSKTINAHSYDRFLFCWIALEILSMNSSTDIKPIKQFLSKAYGLRIDEIESTFCIGKMYGLRSKIVHEGYTPNLLPAFLDYCELLFIDVFNEVIGNNCQKLALKYENFNASTYLSTIL